LDIPLMLPRFNKLHIANIWQTPVRCWIWQKMLLFCSKGFKFYREKRLYEPCPLFFSSNNEVYSL